MSASLVGSEMCIRDRSGNEERRPPVFQLAQAPLLGASMLGPRKTLPSLPLRWPASQPRPTPAPL
eukprot:10805660-Alexandrium_andersonii.AAC.1